MSISRDDVLHVARLARLTLSDAGTRYSWLIGKYGSAGNAARSLATTGDSEDSRMKRSLSVRHAEISSS